jgi:myosin-5
MALNNPNVDSPVDFYAPVRFNSSVIRMKSNAKMLIFPILQRDPLPHAAHLAVSRGELSLTHGKGVRAWFADEAEGWLCGECKTKRVDAAGNVAMTFVLDDSEKTVEFKANMKDLQANRFSTLPPLKNPPQLDGLDDLTQLSNLHEPDGTAILRKLTLVVLHNIKIRYAQKQIYTFSGIVLVALNPYQRLNIYNMDVMRQYAGKKRSDVQPHLFAIGEESYSNMVRDSKPQSIIVSGESGAGKTQSAKYIMRYFATVDDLDNKATTEAENEFGINMHATVQHGGMSEIEEAVLATNPITEAFGNAKTTRNDNSSRFGKYIQIQFSKPSRDVGAKIVGAKIRTYLLERSRLVFQPIGERNFHIFYQLCAGCPAAEKVELGLSSYENFFYLNQGQDGVIPGVDDAAEFQLTQHALSQIGISVSMQWKVFRICAALLHIGNIKIEASRSGEAQVSETDPSLIWACKLIGVDNKEFAKWLTRKQISTRMETVVTNLSVQQSTTVRDSVAKYIYVALFDWITSKVNENLDRDDAEAARVQGRSFIGVLDIYGFEHFKKNSFEQFCINYANEKLQQEFNEHVFKLEQEEYVREQIDWSRIDFYDNQPCIDLIEGKLGILDLLDEESRLPSGTDATLVNKLYQRFAAGATTSDFFEKPRFASNAFTVKHYALNVTYDIEAFLEKNKDTVTDEQLTVLNSTRDDFLGDVLATLQLAVEQNTPAKPDRYGQAKGKTQKTSLGAIFKASLIELMKTIRATEVHYIRCIKPNSTKTPFGFEPVMVLAQLRACGVLETIRISCAGYPSRWTYEEFVDRYYMLATSKDWNFANPREFTEHIVRSIIKDQDKYQFGLTKVFFRTGMLSYFEKLRTDRLNQCVTVIQRNIKRYIAQKEYRSIRNATVKIQTQYRGYKARQLYKFMRETAAVNKIAKSWRGYAARTKWRRTRNSIVRFQAIWRGYQAWKQVYGLRLENAATKIQSAWRGYSVRRDRIKMSQKVTAVQAQWRRRQARKELMRLRAEAKSLNKLIEVKYQLENKVFELSQRLIDRENERQGLLDRLQQLETAMLNWKDKFEKADTQLKAILEPAAQTKRDLVEREKVLVETAQLMTTMEETNVELQQKNQALEAAGQSKDALIAELQQQVEAAHEREAEFEAGKSEVESKREALARQRQDNAKLLDRMGAIERGDQILELQVEVDMLKKELDVARNMAGGKVSQVSRDDEMMRLRKDVVLLKKMLARSRGEGPHDDPESAFGKDILFSERESELIREILAGDFEPKTNGLHDDSPPPRGSSMAPSVAESAHIPDDSRVVSITDDGKVLNLEGSKILSDDALVREVVDRLIVNLNPPKCPRPDQKPLARREVFFAVQLVGVIAQTMLKHDQVAPNSMAPHLANLTTSVLRAIQSTVLKSRNDDQTAGFWLSNTAELFSILSNLRDVDRKRSAQRSRAPSGTSDMDTIMDKAVNDVTYLLIALIHHWLESIKTRLVPLVVPGVVEHEELQQFQSKKKGGLFGGIGKSAPKDIGFTEVINFVDRIDRVLKGYYTDSGMLFSNNLISLGISRTIMTETFRIIGYTAFNDLIGRRQFSTWKRGIQIQYNVTKLQEWVSTKEYPDALRHLEPVLQATKLLQLSKQNVSDLDTIVEVCFVLNAEQIHRLLINFYAGDFDPPVSQALLKEVAKRTGGGSDSVLLSQSATELPRPQARAVPIQELQAWIPGYIVEKLPRVLQVLEQTQ